MNNAHPVHRQISLLRFSKEGFSPPLKKEDLEEFLDCSSADTILDYLETFGPTH
jgi:hypothetical protein